MTLAPKLLMTLWIRIFPMDTKLCCRVLGMATTRICRRIRPENAGAFMPFSSAAIRFMTVNIAAAQLNPWQMNVAQATPATPMLKNVTKT